MSSFEDHRIDHISASSCNLFAAQPALWVAEKLLGRKSPVGAAAHRGTAVEAGVSKGLLDPNASIDDCVAEAESVYRQKTALSGDPKRDLEGDAVAPTVRMVLPELRAYGPGVVCQERIEWQSEGISVPWLGFTDFHWPENGVLIDLKTQLRLASNIKVGHARQVALYAGARGHNTDARICYATPKKSAVYQLENARQHLASLEAIARTIERFLAVSKDANELAGLLCPDVDAFYYSDPRTRQMAFELWGL